MKQNIEELRKKYMDNPPEGITSKDIRLMSEDELLDMDYFLNANYAQTECQFRYCGTAIPFLTVRSAAR